MIASVVVAGVEWSRALAEPFTWHFPLLNGLVEAIGAQVGLPAASLRLVVYLLLNFALALGLRVLPERPMWARHAWCAAAGILCAQFIMGAFWIQTLLSTTLCYVLLLVLPPALANIAVLITAFFFVSVSHIHRVAVPADDYSAAQMTMTIKLTSLAFSLYDAHVLRTNPASIPATRALVEAPTDRPDRKQIVLEERKRLSVATTPSPIEYLGYVYFFVTMITGPAISYHEYSTTLDGSKMKAARATSGKPLSASMPAIKWVAVAVSFMVVHAVGAQLFPLSSMWAHAPTYLGEGLVPRLANMWLAIFFERCKYYFAWSIAEAACITAEFGYNGMDANGYPRWDGINNMDIVAYELSESPRDASVRWNRVTGEWLRFCIYDRLPANSALQMFGIYTASAFWHGFWPGYYLFFLSAGVLQLCARSFRTLVRPIFLQSKTYKRVYDLAGIAVTQILVSYFGAAFMCLTVENTLFTWSTVGFVGHILMAIVFAVSLAAPLSSLVSSRSPVKQKDH